MSVLNAVFKIPALPSHRISRFEAPSRVGRARPAAGTRLDDVLLRYMPVLEDIYRRYSGRFKKPGERATSQRRRTHTRAPAHTTTHTRQVRRRIH